MFWWNFGISEPFGGCLSVCLSAPTFEELLLFSLYMLTSSITDCFRNIEKPPRRPFQAPAHPHVMRPGLARHFSLPYHLIPPSMYSPHFGTECNLSLSVCRTCFSERASDLHNQKTLIDTTYPTYASVCMRVCVCVWREPLEPRTSTYLSTYLPFSISVTRPFSKRTCICMQPHRKLRTT